IFADAYSKDPDFFAFYRSMQAYEQGFRPAGTPGPANEKSGETRMLISPDTDFFRYFSSPQGSVRNPGAAPAKQ
ncbi:hypothetical protein ABTM54_19875, partial [Acinetobacter baumannii]